MLGVGFIELIARKQGAIKLADALRFWPYCLAGILGLFLLLQLVLKLGRGAARLAATDSIAPRRARLMAAADLAPCDFFLSRSPAPALFKDSDTIAVYDHLTF